LGARFASIKDHLTKPGALEATRTQGFSEEDLVLKVHLDTDLGGDIDDICALAMLLCWPQEIQITGITTVGELNGRRAGQVKYVLGLVGRNEIPVAAGADVSQGFYPTACKTPGSF